uniref:UDP-glucuronosyltransferase n=1 Tax=Culicoides sonorensis TaxID=179676 RepID=A0A336L5U5_CULSO
MKLIPILEKIISLIFCLNFCFSYYDAANILAIFHTPSKSHLLLAQPLLFELAREGHEVTVVSPFPEKNPPKGYIDIAVPEVIEFTRNHWKTIFDHVNDDYFTIITRMIKSCAVMTNNTLTHPKVKKLISNSMSVKFDLLFIEVFLNDAFLGFAELFDCPVIVMSTVGMTPWANDYIGNPTPISYLHNGLLPYSDKMSIKEKFISLAVNVVERLITYFYLHPKQNAIFSFNFPNSRKTLSELRKEKVSVLFLNSHSSFTSPRPYFKNVVEVGGMQIKNDTNEELPEDIKKFMDEADYGVILFAMGSNLKPSLMHNSTKEAILSGLASLPQKIILKWDDPHVQVDPNKFLVKTWVPQNLILNHKNTKVFITHGGLLSCFEAVNYAVPILGIPMFGDQTSNVDMAEKGGWGLKLKYTDITIETLREKLIKLTEDSSYQEMINNISMLYRDQLVPPLNLARYWVEYVIKHKGAYHLKSSVLDLKYYQFYNLDLLLILSLILFVMNLIFTLTKNKIMNRLKTATKEKLM